MAFENAQRLAGQSPAGADAEARKAIDAAVRAFWWAEDTELEAAQHELMHRIGRWTRREFGCSVHFNGTQYERRCPIDIAHTKMGLSPGYTCILICSICGGDLSECPHLRDRAYWVRGGPFESHPCPVCMQPDCGHRPDRLYRVSVTANVTQIRAHEVSFVRRPVQPEARIISLSISNDDLAKALGPEFRPGIPLSCDKCLGGCWGFNEFEPPGSGEADPEHGGGVAPVGRGDGSVDDLRTP
jgi:hypothetical protein